MAVRLAMGATRWRVIRQLLTESSLLSALGGIAALLLSLWASEFFSGVEIRCSIRRRECERRQPRVAVHDGRGGVARRRVRVDAGVAIVTSCACPGADRYPLDAAVPPLVAAIEPPRGAGRRLARPARGGGARGRSQTRAARADVGFKPAGVNVFAMDLAQGGYDVNTGPALYQNILREVSAAPGVQSASLAFQLPLVVVGMITRGVEVDGYTPGPREDMNFGYNIVSERYFDTMRIPLVRGRAFERRDSADAEKVAVVNEPFARRYFQDRDPVGRTIRVAGDAYRIVGVVNAIK